MEKYYEKNVKEQTINQYQPEASAPLAYENELSQEEKENILKDIYSCIKLFYTIVCKEQRKSSLTQ